MAGTGVARGSLSCKRMNGSPSRTLRAFAIAAATALTAAALAACGGSQGDPAPPGVVVSGPGVQATKPPWKAEYAHVKQRLALLQLPSPGTEKFHVHQLLHVYVDGLLVPVPANIGVDRRQGVASALHTHDSTGVIHMEADKPFRATLGDLFTVWGLRLGPASLGGLEASGDRPLQVFANGRRLADPAAHVLRKNDNIVVAYGSMDGVPRVPDATALKAANGSGRTPVACSTGKNGKKPTRCFAAK